MQLIDLLCRGAQINVRESDQVISLWVNGICRDEARCETQTKLSSTVQTGYEWHEYVEAVCERRNQSLFVRVYLNQEEIAAYPSETGINK